MEKYPYFCKRKNDLDWWVPTMVDYENKMFWKQNGQSNGNGEWVDFEDCEIKQNKQFNFFAYDWHNN